MSNEWRGDEHTIDPLTVTVSVLESEESIEQLPDEVSPDVAVRRELAFRLLDEMKVVTSCTGWAREVVASHLGCDHPDPRTWLDVDVSVLKQSVAVVSLMREHMELCATRPVDHLRQYLAAAADLDPEADPQLRTVGDFVLSLVERRTASRESIALSVEMLSRVKGDVDAARQLLFDASSDHTTSDVVQSDRLGEAREEALDLWKAMRAESRDRALEPRFVHRTREELVEIYGLEAVERAERERLPDSADDDPRDNFSPDEVREYVRNRSRRR